MILATILHVLLFHLVFPASAGEADAPQLRYRTPEEARQALEAMMPEIEPRIGELKALQARYGLDPDFRTLESERARLRADLEERNILYKETFLSFSTLRKAVQAGEFQNLLSKGKSADFSAKVARSLALEAFDKDARSFQYRVHRALEAEEAAYAEAKEALRRKRGMRYAAAGLALMLAAPLAVWGLRGRALRAPEGAALLSTPLADAAALSSPASAPVSAAPARPGLPAPGQASLPAYSMKILGERFSVERELGRGGIGTVFEAMDLSLGRQVALKKVREELCQSPKELERFLAQAASLTALRHPDIVETHGVVRDGSDAYLILEFVSGGSLDRFLERGRLPLASLKGLLLHASAALDHAHSCGHLHLDLKPSNLMITRERGLKVADFALAHQAAMTASRVSGAAAWNTAYLAPEQELGESCRESDFYALAVCLYEAATGALPFPGPDFLAQKRGMAFVPPSKAAGLPPSFDAFMAKALQPEPKNRFHSGAEMAAALPGGS